MDALEQPTSECEGRRPTLSSITSLMSHLHANQVIIFGPDYMHKVSVNKEIDNYHAFNAPVSCKPGYFEFTNYYLLFCQVNMC